MYANVAYLGVPHEDIVINDKDIVVTAAGNFRMEKSYVYETDRPKGRNDYQLYYVAEGKVHFYFDGKEKIITKGNMVLYRPGEPQKYNIYAKDKPETYWVHFTGNEAEKLLNDYDFKKGNNLFFSGSSFDYRWIFNQIIRELQLRRKNYDDLLTLSLRNIFLMVNRYLSESKNAGYGILDEMENAVHYFNENYHKNILIEEYAASRHMTVCWFIQNFKSFTKTTPMQYLVSLRITNAMKLFENREYNVSQVSAAVGYENPLYFSRLFKKHTGMSPSEYRKRIHSN